MVQVLRGVRRVLRDDGTVWLNIADSLAGSWGNYGARHGQQRPATAERLARKAYDTNTARPPASGTATGLKPKARAGIPERLILALQADGWWYRSDITWAKVAAMPESVTDRLSRTSEHVYMLAKRAHYFYDNLGYREPLAESTVADPRNGTGRHTQGPATSKYYDAQTPDGTAADKPSWYRAKSFVNQETGRNARDVWSLTPEASNIAFCAACGEAYATSQMKRFQVTAAGAKVCPNCQASDRWVAHFAAYPSELPRRAILLGTSEAGVCPRCGAPWERIVERAGTGPQRQTRKHAQTRLNTLAGSEYQTWRNAHPDVTTGWQPTCGCGATGDWQPGDSEIIATPTGTRAGADPTLHTGRGGFNRPRGDHEGQRPITRYEQRQYAAQIKASPHYAAMAEAAGPAIAHYTRTDRAGARPVPDGLLNDWLARGWLTRVTVPDFSPLAPIPATVLDPFVGSGTTLITAKQLGRHGIGIDLRADYVALTAARLARTQPALRVAPPEDEDPEPDAAATQLSLEIGD